MRLLYAGCKEANMRSAMVLAVLFCLCGAARAGEDPPAAVPGVGQKMTCKGCGGSGFCGKPGSRSLCLGCGGVGEYFYLTGPQTRSERDRIVRLPITPQVAVLKAEIDVENTQAHIRKLEQDLGEAKARLERRIAILASVRQAAGKAGDAVAPPPAKAEDKPKPVMKVELLPSPAEKEAPAGG